MKIKLTLLMLLTASFAFSQWRYESGNNQFDGKYKVSWVQGKGNKFPFRSPIFTINEFESGSMNMYFGGIGYTGCDYNTLQFAFGDNVVYEATDLHVDRDDDLLFIRNIKGISKYRFIQKLMEKSKLYVRFSNSCTSNDMEFSLSGSTKAIKYAIPVWLNEEEEGYKLSKDELSKVKEYYLKLSCEDLLDTVKPMYTDYMENTSVLFETQEGTNGILAGTLVQVKNSNKLNHKIKIWATRNSKTTEFHVTPEEAKKFINEHDVIEAMDKGLSDFWRRMENCE